MELCVDRINSKKVPEVPVELINDAKNANRDRCCGLSIGIIYKNL